MAERPTGGKTPLADGLAVALQTLSMLNKHDSELEPILVLVTDGRANATEADGGDPVASALKMAERIGRLKSPPWSSIRSRTLSSWAWLNELQRPWELIITRCSA
ncbi:MAG: hypothetical protein U0K79_03200 [Phascolarctobacterium sp.]|nr:hypothetical protein [Phascolarctobacterium sp.]